MNEFRMAKIEEILASGYEFNLGSYINKGMDLFRKEIGLFVLFTLIGCMAMGVGSSLPLIGQFITPIVITPLFLGGIYLAAHQVNKGRKISLEDFFKVTDYFKPLSMVGLISGLIIPIIFIVPAFVLLILTTPMIAESFGLDSMDFSFLATDNSTVLIIIALLFLVPYLYFSVAYSFAHHFVVFHNLPFWDALETSRKLINQKWFSFFSLYLVAMLLMSVGILFLVVGLLVTLPLIYCIFYAAFAEITELSLEGEANDEIIDHLVV